MTDIADCTPHPQVIEKLPSQLVGGIYWGLAQVDRGPVYDMVRTQTMTD